MPRFWPLLLLLILPCAVTLPAALAGTVNVLSASSTVVNDIYLVDADLRFEFSADATEALASGVPLIVEVKVRITRKRRYLWDPEVLEVTRKYRVERHALSERYVVTDLATEDRGVFTSADSAIAGLGKIRGLPIADRGHFAADATYLAALRARLDIESLPAPLRPLAWISPGWRMSSKWFRWPLTR